MPVPTLFLKTVLTKSESLVSKILPISLAISTNSSSAASSLALVCGEGTRTSARVWFYPYIFVHYMTENDSVGFTHIIYIMNVRPNMYYGAVVGRGYERFRPMPAKILLNLSGETDVRLTYSNVFNDNITFIFRVVTETISGVERAKDLFYLQVFIGCLLYTSPSPRDRG